MSLKARYPVSVPSEPLQPIHCGLQILYVTSGLWVGMSFRNIRVQKSAPNNHMCGVKCDCILRKMKCELSLFGIFMSANTNVWSPGHCHPALGYDRVRNTVIETENEKRNTLNSIKKK